jgi:hypothetical protein
MRRLLSFPPPLVLATLALALLLPPALSWATPRQRRARSALLRDKQRTEVLLIKLPRGSALRFQRNLTRTMIDKGGLFFLAKSLKDPRRGGAFEHRYRKYSAGAIQTGGTTSRYSFGVHNPSFHLKRGLRGADWLRIELPGAVDRRDQPSKDTFESLLRSEARKIGGQVVRGPRVR